ncbi:MAG: hypothetical protein HYZ81_17020 [Nitrospinae bacterium]|nr:hypothetical protein [Nitrospinota bacterium]
MSGYKGPLDIPLLGYLIAQVVEAFAKDQRPPLAYDLWYHGEPVWLIFREIKEDNFFQQVQVAAFLTQQGEQLLFMPQAYRFEGEQLKTTPAPLIAPKILQHPLKEFSALSEDAIRKKAYSLLADAWKSAEAFREADLTQQV